MLFLKLYLYIYRATFPPDFLQDKCRKPYGNPILLCTRSDIDAPAGGVDVQDGVNVSDGLNRSGITIICAYVCNLLV